MSPIACSGKSSSSQRQYQTTGAGAPNSNAWHRFRTISTCSRLLPSFTCLLLVALLALAGCGGSASSPVPATATVPPSVGSIREFTLPQTQGGDPFGIAAGRDGNLWFTLVGNGWIGRITPTGHISEFALPQADSSPEGIVAGPDGNLWFTERHSGKIGRITPTGSIHEFALPHPTSGPFQITKGPDGNLWFTEYEGNKIGRISPAGVVTEFATPTPYSSPAGITAGPDGNLWFAESNANKIGRITIAR
ncbi:MAG TPA: hypothetical protein VJ761_05085 [Ktedonobacteraceae bacterium]|nr:hypothetical protein [Ktedonobacteraceae bacterium]